MHSLDTLCIKTVHVATRQSTSACWYKTVYVDASRYTVHLDPRQSIIKVYQDVYRGLMHSFDRQCIKTVYLDTTADKPRVKWRGLKIGGGNLIHRKVVFCIFRCKSIWMGMSGDNLSSRIFWRNHKFEKTKWLQLSCGKRTLCCA